MSDAFSEPMNEDDDYPEVTQTDLDRATFRAGLKPAPQSGTAIKKIEITLQIDTGNIIYGEFTNMEEALAFVRKYAQSPHAILEKIKPKGVA